MDPQSQAVSEDCTSADLVIWGINAENVIGFLLLHTDEGRVEIPYGQALLINREQARIRDARELLEALDVPGCLEDAHSTLVVALGKYEAVVQDYEDSGKRQNDYFLEINEINRTATAAYRIAQAEGAEMNLTP